VQTQAHTAVGPRSTNEEAATEGALPDYNEYPALPWVLGIWGLASRWHRGSRDAAIDVLRSLFRTPVLHASSEVFV
jgi:hypothetical protein